MKAADNVKDKVGRLARGYVFTYDDFVTTVNDKEAIIKALNRLAKTNVIRKLSKGRFYKPEVSPFGELPPSEYQIAKDLLEKGGKTIGYLTGYSIYNKLGLSTQLSSAIQIGRNDPRSSFIRDKFRISFIKQKNNITKENIPLLQILDALRFIQKIPDASMPFLCKRFLSIINELSEDDLNRMIRLSLKYPPATRALLGAFVSELNKSVNTDTLFKSLNPITVYKIGISTNELSTAENWHIK